MGSDDWSFGEQPPEGPGWAPYLDAEGFHSFLQTVIQDLGRRGFEAREDDGVVEVRRGDQSSRCGLQNLAQVCAQNPRGEWPTIIQEHFDKVLMALDGTLVPEDFGQDFEAVRGQLRPRMMSEETLGQVGTGCVSRIVSGDLATVLVFDMPETTMTVKPDYLDSWGKTVDEVMEIAVENLAETEDLAADKERFDLEGGGYLDVYGDDYYTASHILLLGRYLDPTPRFGALVAIPHRHAMLVHPIQDLRVIPTLNALIGIAAGMFQEGPGSICPHLYWWRDGALVRLQTEVEDDSLVFRPPQEFMDVLEALEEPPGSVS